MNKLLNKSSELLRNKNVSMGLTVALVLYVAMFSDRLPHVSEFVRSTLGRLVVCCLVVFLSSRNVTLAVLLALAFVVTVQVENFTPRDAKKLFKAAKKKIKQLRNKRNRKSEDFENRERQPNRYPRLLEEEEELLEGQLEGQPEGPPEGSFEGPQEEQFMK